MLPCAFGDDLVALERCIRNVYIELKKRLPLWKIEEPNFNLDKKIKYARVSHLELSLWKKSWEDADGEPRLWVVFATEGCHGATRFDTYVSKSEGFSPPQSVSFCKEEYLTLGPGKGDWVKPFSLPGVRELRSAKGLSQLLTHQGTAEITEWILRFIDDYEVKMDECFPQS